MRLLVFALLVGAVMCTQNSSSPIQKQKKVEKRGFRGNNKHVATSSVTISVGDAPPVTHYNTHDTSASDDHFDLGTTTSSSLQPETHSNTGDYDNGYGLVQSHAQSYSSMQTFTNNEDHPAQEHGNNYADTHTQSYGNDNSDSYSKNPFGDKDSHSQSFEIHVEDEPKLLSPSYSSDFGEQNRHNGNYGNSYDGGKTKTQNYVSAVTHTSQNYNNNNFGHSNNQNFGGSGATSSSSITQSFGNDDFDNSHFNNFESHSGNQNKNNNNFGNSNTNKFSASHSQHNNNNNDFEFDTVRFTTEHPLQFENQNRQSFGAAKANLVSKYKNSYSQLYGGVHADSAAKTQVKPTNVKENSHEEINIEIQDGHENHEFSHDAMNQAEVLNVYLGDKPRIEMHQNPRESDVIQEQKDTGRVSSQFSAHMDWTPGNKPTSYKGADVPITPPIQKHCSYDTPKFGGKPLSANKEVIKSIMVFKEHKYPVPKPYPVPVYKHVGVPVYHRVPYHVEKPYPVYVAKPYRVPVYKHVPFTLVKHVPYPVHVPVKVPVYQHYPIHVDKLVPYHVPFQVKVPVPQHYDVHKPVVVDHHEIHRIRIHEH